MALHKLKGSIKGKLSGAGDKLSSLKNAGMDKALEYVNNINDVLPIIAQTGYTLMGMSTTISIPPGINLDFQKTKDVSKQDVEKILEKHPDRPVLKLIVDSLVNANEFHNRIKLGNLHFIGILIDLSIPPKVTMKFAKK